MKRFVCFVLPLAALLPARAAPPAVLASALEYLRDQRSYSWEVINADPGPVAQSFETRRGTVTTVQQNLSPHIAGSIDLNGDLLLRREWSDGTRLETLITSGGALITNTPEGWLTNQEILTAQAEERLRGGPPSPRAIWLRRADRPEVRRPDQELVPMLKTKAKFEEVAADTFVSSVRLQPGSDRPVDAEDNSQPTYDVTITMHLRAGVIRDYEVAIEGSRPVSRARVRLPVSDHRIVILTYLPVRRVDVPAEAWEKLKAARTPVR